METVPTSSVQKSPWNWEEVHSNLVSHSDVVGTEERFENFCEKLEKNVKDLLMPATDKNATISDKNELKVWLIDAISDLHHSITEKTLFQKINHAIDSETSSEVITNYIRFI